MGGEELSIEARAHVLSVLIQPYVSSGRLVPIELEAAMRRLVKETEVRNDND